MKIKNLQLFLIITLIYMFGCATTPDITPDARRAILKIQILKSNELNNSGYEKLGQIEGVSCKRNAYSSVEGTREDAQDKLKYKAYERGADAVIDVLCEEKGVSMSDNCWKTIICYGDAVKLR